MATCVRHVCIVPIFLGWRRFLDLLIKMSSQLYLFTYFHPYCWKQIKKSFSHTHTPKKKPLNKAIVIFFCNFFTYSRCYCDLSRDTVENTKRKKKKENLFFFFFFFFFFFWLKECLHFFYTLVLLKFSAIS